MKKMKFISPSGALLGSIALTLLAGCKTASEHKAETRLTLTEAQQIAQDA